VRKIEKKEEAPAAPTGPARYKVSVNGRDYSIAIDGDTATVDGRAFNVGMRPDTGDAAPVAAAGASGGGTPVKAEMPGKVIRLLVHVGDHVEAGEGVLVLEAMKMEMQITAPSGGTVTDIAVAAGDQVAAGDVLAHVG